MTSAESDLPAFAAPSRFEDLLIEADRAIVAGSLAGGIVHDLRGPLQTLNMLTDPLADLGRGTEAARLRQAVSDSVQRLAVAIARFSRIYAPPRGDPGPVIVRELFGHVADLQLLQRGLPAVTVELRLTDGLAPVRGVEGELQHLLLGLVSNSKQALDGRTDGAITLGAAPGDGVVLMTVEDNGHGIPDGVLGRAFEPFFSTRPGRAGIGLAVGRWLAARHGGSLTLEPGHRGGVRAVVRLPLWRGAIAD